MKQLHLKSMIVGLVFGVMSVLTLNNYSQSPIQNAYANDCPKLHDIKKAVKQAVGDCTLSIYGETGYVDC